MLSYRTFYFHPARLSDILLIFKKIKTRGENDMHRDAIPSTEEKAYCEKAIRVLESYISLLQGVIENHIQAKQMKHSYITIITPILLVILNIVTWIFFGSPIA
jgi:hypothetical protein